MRVKWDGRSGRRTSSKNNEPCFMTVITTSRNKANMSGISRCSGDFIAGWKGKAQHLPEARWEPCIVHKDKISLESTHLIESRFFEVDFKCLVLEQGLVTSCFTGLFLTPCHFTPFPLVTSASRFCDHALQLIDLPLRTAKRSELYIPTLSAT